LKNRVFDGACALVQNHISSNNTGQVHPISCRGRTGTNPNAAQQSDRLSPRFRGFKRRFVLAAGQRRFLFAETSEIIAVFCGLLGVVGGISSSRRKYRSSAGNLENLLEILFSSGFLDFPQNGNLQNGSSRRGLWPQLNVKDLAGSA
jgi:hypothetical protein